MNRQPIKLLADENIPALERFLGDQVDIHYRPGREITPDDLKDKDALLVRSVTKVNRELLHNSPIRFVGSSTIGMDHMDEQYLQSARIAFSNAKGCNSAAVVDYVLAAMLHHLPDISLWRQKTVGIIGLGSIGSDLTRRLKQLNIRTLCFDPFVEAAKNTLDEVLSADCISCHTPLTTEGDFPTTHLINLAALQQIQPSALLINAARGAVVDNDALKHYLSEHDLAVVLDVFENEPLPDAELLPLLTLATPHIAGYSEQGKIRGSLIVAKALASHFSLRVLNADYLEKTRIDAPRGASIDTLLHRYFPIGKQSDHFIKGYLGKQTINARAGYFDDCRKNYPLRKEWGFIMQRNDDQSQLAENPGFSQS